VGLREDHLFVRELRVGGSALEAARQATEQDHDLETVVRAMLDIGGNVLLRGTSQAVIDSFQAEMRGALNVATEQITGARAVRAERDRGTEKGLSYEALVAETSAWVCSQDDVEFTGGIRGEEGNKNGDVLVRLNRTATRDHDLRIVLEAKDERKAEPAMLAELDAAIRNRAAEAGIFVFAKRQQAPLDGRALRVYSGNRFAIVFDKMTKTTKIRSRSKPSAEWPAEFSSPSSTNKHHQSILSSSPTGSSASTTSSTTPPRSPVFSNPRVGASTRSKAAMNSSLATPAPSSAN